MSDSNGGSSDAGVLALLLLLALVVLVGIPVLIILVIPMVILLLFLLSAVLGTFVLGVGDAQTAAPQATFDFEYDAGQDTVIVTHSGGDSIDADRLRVIVDGEMRGTWAQFGDTDTAQAGDDVVLDGIESGDTIRLLYEGEDGSSVMAQFDVP